MPSFTSRRYPPDRLRSLSVSKPSYSTDDDLMEDITHHSARPNMKTSSLNLAPSDGSLLDYFDLPSPPSTPHQPIHSLSYSSLNSFPSPTTSPGLVRSTSTSRTSSPPSSPPSSWPTPSQRTHHNRLPTRPRSRSVSSSSSISSSSSTGLGSGDIEMGGMPTSMSSRSSSPGGPTPLVRAARRTPYYPPNASRNSDRSRVYMNRGPHYIPNWTPLSSLPRHVQLQIEERMVRFTAI